MPITIYHNTRCSKSRQTLQLLTEREIEPEIFEYLKTPPSADNLADVLKMLGISARELMRKKEAEYKSIGADNPGLTEQQLIDLMVANPKLIERPIVTQDGKAAIGRPPEQGLAIL